MYKLKVAVQDLVLITKVIECLEAEYELLDQVEDSMLRYRKAQKIRRMLDSMENKVNTLVFLISKLEKQYKERFNTRYYYPGE